MEERIFVVYEGQVMDDCTGLNYFAAYFTKSEEKAMEFYNKLKHGYVVIQPLDSAHYAHEIYDTTKACLPKIYQRGVLVGEFNEKHKHYWRDLNLP